MEHAITLLQIAIKQLDSLYDYISTKAIKEPAAMVYSDVLLSVMDMVSDAITDINNKGV